MIFYFKKLSNEFFLEFGWEFESVNRKEFIESIDMFRFKISKPKQNFNLKNNFIIYRSISNKIYPFNYEIVKDEYKKHLINYRDKRINEILK